jgi:tryptophanyl-tRNA synthetase
MNKRIFSGIQPSGVLTIGNYIGAIKQFIELQNNYDCIFSIVDYHAITQDYDPKKLPERIMSAALDFLACGIDPEKSTIFVQSDRPEHTELAWILNTITPLGDLQRMTQFKEKSSKVKDINAGLLNYPILMAADILIYKAEKVPVGEDQIQHIELTREIARRFNSKFGETFPEPKPIIRKGSRILGLDGLGKMSKSNPPHTYIALSDAPEIIRQKVGAAVTDQGNEKEISAGSQNLLTLLEIFAGADVAQKFIEQRKKSEIKYSELKPVLAEAIIKELEPIQKKRAELEKDPNAIKKILSAGAQKLEPVAKKTLKEVKQKIGLKY